jgi:hypothetical protein
MVMLVMLVAYRTFDGFGSSLQGSVSSGLNANFIVSNTNGTDWAALFYITSGSVNPIAYVCHATAIIMMLHA